MRVIKNVALMTTLLCAAGVATAGAPDHNTAARFLAHMPLSFERNRGQVTDKSADWVGRGNGYRLALSATGATIISSAPGRSDPVRMEFVNCRTEVPAQARKPLPGKTNYLIGRDPKLWIQNVATYGRIEYQKVYDGIDVAWYGNQGQLEWDFLVQPGADPSRIRVRFEGAQRLTLASAREVRIETAAGPMTLRLPEMYQEIAGARKPVQGRYVLRAASEVGVDLAGYDKSRPLVIDPTLGYGTYFGNSGLGATAITTDAQGAVYLGGTGSSGLPLANAMQPAVAGNGDVWVAKFDPTGRTLLYSTWVGGSGGDVLTTQNSLAATTDGELIAAGYTGSTDFPLVNPIQTPGPTGPHFVPFAFKLTATGSAFVYSTYLSGGGDDTVAWAVATDAAGSAYVAGQAEAAVTTTPGTYQSVYGGGWSDALAMKLGPGGALLYSTLIGGSGLDYATSIAVDPEGNAYLAGLTDSSSFPSNPPGARATKPGRFHTFVAKLSPGGDTVAWLALLGGSGNDIPIALVRDNATGALYVAGQTTSRDLPTTAGAVQPAPNGPEQGFAASIRPDGLSFGFVTYLGGAREDAIMGLAVAPGGLVVAGQTTSTGFPMVDAIQSGFAGPAASLYKSTNSGASWTAADAGLPGAVAAISADLLNPGTMLAAAPGVLSNTYAEYAWFRTADGGASWTRSGELALRGPWWHATGGQFVRSRSNPAVVYFSYPDSVGQGTPPANGSTVIAFRSDDGGATWQRLADPPAASNDNLMGIVVSPTDANTILELTYNGVVFRSTDGGASFTQVSTLPSGFAWISAQSVVGSPDGSVYVATNGNIYRSQDFGTTWTPANGIPGWEGYGPVAVAASNPSVVYAATLWAPNLYRTTDAGITWNRVSAFPGVPYSGSGATLAVAPTDSNVVYVASGNQMVFSTNGGVTWSKATSLAGNIWAVAVSATDPTVVYAGVSATIDGFAAKLSSDGRRLLWSTFYSGSNGASVSGVAAGAAGDVWIAGSTSSIDLPITPNAYSSSQSGGAAFFARISDPEPPPVIIGMPAPGCTLWPPNGKLVEVASISASAGVGMLSSFTVTATSNEPANPGPDIAINGTGLQPRTVQLRAARLGTGTGRVYTITASAANTAGLVVTATATCTVPHDQGH